MTENAKSGRTAVMLSAFVYPGAGQLMQKRWIAGGVFAFAFTLFFILLAISVVTPLFAYLNNTLDFASAQGMGADNTPDGISFVKVALYFLAGMMVYFASLADVVAATRRDSKPPKLPPPA
jgi:hypothetical protein